MPHFDKLLEMADILGSPTKQDRAM